MNGFSWRICLCIALGGLGSASFAVYLNVNIVGAILIGIPTGIAAALIGMAWEDN